MLEGLQPSIGGVGDAYDNAAETVMGLFKNEAVAPGSPFRTGALKTEADVIEVVFEWVHWYNNQCLHSFLGHQTPEEFEQAYYAREIGSLPDDAANMVGPGEGDMTCVQSLGNRGRRTHGIRSDAGDLPAGS